jgi:hypothetical protein
MAAVEADGTGLWCAVILQAIKDATTKATSYPKIELSRHEARTWLLGQSRDFIAVCNYAGVEPEKVRALAVKMINDADIPGEGRNFSLRLGTGGGRHARERV